MKRKYREVKSIWLSIEKRIDFAIMKLIYNRLDKKNMPENLQSDVVKSKKNITQNFTHANA